MLPFNDNAAWLSKSGNLTLGMSVDDSAGSYAVAGVPTYSYAKNDVTISISGSLLTTNSSQPALTYVTGDIPTRRIVAGATHKITIPAPWDLYRTTTVPSGLNSAGVSSTPKGILIKSLALYYRVQTNNLDSATMVINTTPLAAGADLPTVTTLTGTVSGNTLTSAANVYAMVFTVTTPAFISVADQMTWGLATIATTPTNGVADLIGASWRVAVALY